VVLGASFDKLEDQQKFTDKEKLTFPLLADPEKKTITAFGVLNEKGGYANRFTFVIDKKGVVRKIYEVKDIEKHPDELLKYIKDNLADKK
jgi:thioredoxin-dependent peroxiredoxin